MNPVNDKERFHALSDVFLHCNGACIRSMVTCDSCGLMCVCGEDSPTSLCLG